MRASENPGRVAGLWYLLLALLGPLRLIYIPGTLFVPGDAASTVVNITAHEWLFRLGMAADLTADSVGRLAPAAGGSGVSVWIPPALSGDLAGPQRHCVRDCQPIGNSRPGLSAEGLRVRPACADG